SRYRRARGRPLSRRDRRQIEARARVDGGPREGVARGRPGNVEPRTVGYLVSGGSMKRAGTVSGVTLTLTLTAAAVGMTLGACQLVGDITDRSLESPGGDDGRTL